MFRKAAWRQAGGYPLVDKLIDFRLWIAIGALGWRFANLPVVLGEHYVYPESYWKRSFAYRTSQRELARSQTLAIEALGLPLWTRLPARPLRLLVAARPPEAAGKAGARALAGARCPQGVSPTPGSYGRLRSSQPPTRQRSRHAGGISAARRLPQPDRAAHSQSHAGDTRVCLFGLAFIPWAAISTGRRPRAYSASRLCWSARGE